MPRPLAVLLLTLGACFAAPAAHAFDWEFQQWRTGLSLPVSLRFAPDGRLFYIELWNGRIRVFADTTAATSTIWATVPIAIANHRGLMGLALHPAFPDSPYVYFYHTHPSPIVNRVARMTDQGGVGTNYAVIVDGIPAGNRNNGGRIVFAPDGMMLLTMGDNEVSSYAPDPGDIRGKILRYTPMGEPAPGNPFGAGNPVFAKGVRNSYGLAFDPLTGEGFFTENGPECDDEVNHLIAGADYGWGPTDLCGSQPAGTAPSLESFTPPIAPTGCCVYRGSRHPELNGSVMRLHRTGVASVGDPPAPGRFTVSPNPFTAALVMRPPDGRPLERLDIVDAGGRRIRGWAGPLHGTLVWDGRDAGGRPAPAGVYMVRARVAGREHGLRVAKLAP